MTVEKLMRWIEVLPPQERMQPVITIDGVMLTPNEMLSQARADTELGRKAQATWEVTTLGTETELLIERIKRRLERYPPDKPLFFVLGAPSLLTPKDILDNIEKETVIGKSWLHAESVYLGYLSKLGRR